jgi:hypothetical protein
MEEEKAGEEKKEVEEKVEKEGKKKEKSKKLSPVVIVLIILAGIAVALVILARLFGQTLINKLGNTFLNRFFVKDGQVQITDGGKKISYTGEEGEFSFESEGGLPEGFPNDFPIYPEAKVASSWNSSSEETKGYSLILETPDSREKVNTYYKEELTNKGWKITSQFSDQETFTYTFEKDSLSGLVGIGVGEVEKTAISITVGSK